MKPTNLEWEDIIQFKEVEGYGKSIWKNEDKYYLFLEEGTVASWLAVYDLPQELFTQEELERLIPLAEQKWIDWRGKLPDDYVSPLR